MIIIRSSGGSGSNKMIAQAIGEPATEKDKKERLAEIIDNAQSDIASLCNERGCNIPANPTFPQIISGISTITHFTKPAQITGLRSVGAHDTANIIDLYWSNPTNDKNFQGVNIRYKEGSYPTSETDGTSAYDGTGTSVSLNNMANGTTYYFRAFAYSMVDSVRVFNNLASGAECTGVSTLNTPSQITNLRSVGNHDTANIIDLSWSKPSDSKYKGVKILYKTGSYPTSPTDGTVAYNSTGTNVSLSGMSNGTTYYFRAFAYNLSNNIYAYNTSTAGAQCTGVSSLNAANQITGLKATVGSTTSGYVRLTWSNPSDSKFKGVRILYKTGSYPSSPTDGTVLYTGTGTSVEKTGLANGTTYYFRAFAYNVSNNIYAYNTGTSGAQCTGVPYINKGQQIFTSSRTWTVPAGVTSIDIFLVGGGNGGSATYCSSDGKTENGGHGGGGGYVKTVKGISVTPGASFSVSIAAGGTGGERLGISPTVYPTSGGETKFGSYSSLRNEGTELKFTNGGSGGGRGGTGKWQGDPYNGGATLYLNYYGGQGGQDGTNGYYGKDFRKDPILYSVQPGHHEGQHTTTRAFAESSGTLYASGGCGDLMKEGSSSFPGGGGFGTSSTCNGQPNTGGGGAGVNHNNGRGGNGGSGIAIVRWGY